MDLTTNGVVVTEAIKYVQGKMDHLNATEKKLLQDIKNKGDTEDIEDANRELATEIETEQQQTHNSVF